MSNPYQTPKSVIEQESRPNVGTTISFFERGLIIIASNFFACLILEFIRAHLSLDGSHDNSWVFTTFKLLVLETLLCGIPYALCSIPFLLRRKAHGSIMVLPAIVAGAFIGIIGAMTFAYAQKVQFAIGMNIIDPFSSAILSSLIGGYVSESLAYYVLKSIPT